MALTTCPDCQASISDAAPACPKCGRPMVAAPMAAVPVAAPAVQQQAAAVRVEQKPEPNPIETRPCPKCGASVRSDATRCKSCMDKIEAASASWGARTGLHRVAFVAAGVGAVAIIAVPIAARPDKAQPDYAKCVTEDALSNFQHAWDACHDAIKADPQSKSGEAAAAMMASDKYVAWKKSEEERSARASAAYAVSHAAEQAAAAAALRQKVHRERSETFDDSCTGQGKPERSFRYGGGTYDVNAAVAQADGCQPENNTVGWKGFVCCP